MPRGTVTASTAENVDPTTTPIAQLVATYPTVAEVQRIVQAAVDNAERIGGQQIGSITADITTAFSGGSFGPNGYEGGQRDDRSRESTLGSLVADSLLATPVGPCPRRRRLRRRQPGGPARRPAHVLGGATGLPPGAVTYQEANSVLPFGNDLWTTTLTGAKVKELLEQQWQRDESGDVPSRPYLALALSSNVGYTYDPTRPEGDRITSIEIGGKPVDPAGAYRLGTWAILIAGGDNFRAAGQGTDASDSGLLDRDAWIAYLTAHEGIAPNFAKAGVAVTGVPATVQPGDTITLTLDDLDLTSLGAPKTIGLDIAWADSAAFRSAQIAWSGRRVGDRDRAGAAGRARGEHARHHRAPRRDDRACADPGRRRRCDAASG